MTASTAAEWAWARLRCGGHRIDLAVVRAQVQAFGFQLVEDSRLLENPADDHKWPIFEEGKRDQTDQIVYKFRKPVVY